MPKRRSRRVVPEPQEEMVSLTIPTHLVTLVKVIVTVATIKYLQDRFGRAQKSPVRDSGRTHALKTNKDRAKLYKEKVMEEVVMARESKTVKATILEELTRVQACTDLECSEISFSDDTAKLILYQIMMKDYLLTQKTFSPEDRHVIASLDMFDTTSTPQSLSEFLSKVADPKQDSNPVVQQFLRLRPPVVAPSGAPALDPETRKQYVEIIAEMLQSHLNLQNPNPNLTEHEVNDKTGKLLQKLLTRIKFCDTDCPSSAEIKAATDKHPIFKIKQELMTLLAPPKPGLGWDNMTAAVSNLINPSAATAAASILTKVEKVDCMRPYAKMLLSSHVLFALGSRDLGGFKKADLQRIRKKLEELE